MSSAQFISARPSIFVQPDAETERRNAAEEGDANCKDDDRAICRMWNLLQQGSKSHGIHLSVDKAGRPRAELERGGTAVSSHWGKNLHDLFRILQSSIQTARGRRFQLLRQLKSLVMSTHRGSPSTPAGHRMIGTGLDRRHVKAGCRPRTRRTPRRYLPRPLRRRATVHGSEE